jgi:thioredoxin reductase (NADPH)
VHVRDAGVTIITGAQVSRVLGENSVEAVELTVDGAESPHRLPCDRLIAALGFTANLGPIRTWGLELAHNRHVVVDSTNRRQSRRSAHRPIAGSLPRPLH